MHVPSPDQPSAIADIPLLPDPPTNLREMRHLPSPYEHAVLAAHTYRKDSKVGDEVEVIDTITKTRHQLPDWEVLDILQEKAENASFLSPLFRALGTQGYSGRLYLNRKKSQLVLAHGSPDWQHISALKTAVASIADNFTGGQESSMLDILDQARHTAEAHKAHLSITGHSLGGWLAQVCAFIAHHRYPELPVQTVTFDTLGAAPRLEQMNARINSLDLHNHLAITNYLSAPNLINSCSRHLGTVYRVIFSDQFAATESKLWDYTVRSHAIDNFLAAFDPETGDARQCLTVNDWPLLSTDSLKKVVSSDSKTSLLFSSIMLLAKYATGEWLGEYSGFFRLVAQAQGYHVNSLELKGKDSFDLAYKYHYKTEPFGKHWLHRRHLSLPVFHFLQAEAKGSRPHINARATTHLACHLSWDQERNKLSLAKEYGDVRLAWDDLCTLVAQHPDLCTPSAWATVRATRELNFQGTPMAVSSFVGREEVLEKLTAALQRSGKLVVAPPVTGLGGLGKSQLIRHFTDIWKEKRRYDYLLWISADTEEKRQAAYVAMASALGQPEKTVHEAIALVQRRLADKECLYIFEDAPNHGALKPYLQGASGHVLITSRNGHPADWAEQPCQLAGFTETEMRTLAIKLGYDEADPALPRLLATLPTYPLAAAQLLSALHAKGYSAERALGKIASESYLFKLLSEKPPTGHICYEIPMAEILKTSLDALQTISESNLPFLIGQQLAYLDAAAIPLDLLIALASGTPGSAEEEQAEVLQAGDREDAIRDALIHMERLSMIQWDRMEGLVHIHSLTQQAFRWLHPLPTLESMVTRFITYGETHLEDSREGLAFHYSLLPHGRALAAHLEKTPQEKEIRYLLYRQLGKACEVALLYQESQQYREKAVKLAIELFGEAHEETASAYHVLGNVYANQSHYSTALDYYQKALKIREKLLGEHHDTAATYNNIGQVYDWQGHYNQALKYFKTGQNIYEKILGDAHVTTAVSYNNIGSVYMRQGDYTRALDYLQKALNIYEKVWGTEHRYTADSYNNIAAVYTGQGNYSKALEYHQKALRIREKTLGKHPSTAASYNNMGGLYHLQGNYSEALSYYQKALQIQEEVLGEHPDTAGSYNNIGNVHADQSNYSKALEYYQKALEIQEKVLGDHSDTAACYNNIGNVYEGQCNYSKALEYHQKALQIREKVLGEHPATADSYNNTGNVHFGQSNYSEAVRYYQKALQIQRKVLGEHPDTALSYNNIGNVYDRQGNDSEALSYYQKALQIQEKVLGEHPETAACYNNIGAVYAEQCNDSEALKHHQKALQIKEKVLGEHLNTAASYNNLGNIYARQKDYSEALRYYQKGLQMQEKLLGKHPETAVSYNNIGIVYAGQDNDSKALEYHQKALQIQAKVLGEHPATADSYNIIGRVYARQKDYSEALSYFQKALKIREEMLGEHLATADSYNNIGSVYVYQSNYREALSYFQKALKIRGKLLGEHVGTAACYNNIGSVYLEQGDYSEALRYHQKALHIYEKVLGPAHPQTIDCKSTLEYLQLQS